MDFFADNLIKSVINDVILNRDTIPNNTAIWKSLTRLMFKNFPAIQINAWIEDISHEAYDNEWFEHKYTEQEFKEKFVDNLKKPKYKKKFKDYPLLHPEIETIISKVSIVELADRYNLRPLGKLKRICPFHADKDPSLSLNDEKGLFNCFGCSAHGNIVKFKALLKKYCEVKDGRN